MDVVDSLYKGYGEGAPEGDGPNQSLVQTQGNEYLDRDFPKLDRILSTAVTQAPAAAPAGKNP
jgi:peptidyl-prolyl cis-trans isomerase A (cyclophilin A)